MSNSETKCPLCGSTSFFQPDYKYDYAFYICPVCGRFELNAWEGNNKKLDYNKTASYVFYKRFTNRNTYETEYRYHTIRPKDECDLYKTAFEKGNTSNGLPVHMDEEIIDIWFPKRLTDRVDYILDYLGNHTEHFGEQFSFSYEEMISLLFIDRAVSSNNMIVKKLQIRDESDCNEEAKYILDCISDAGYITYSFGSSNNALYITVTPKGYARIDEIQKNTSNGRAVLVAMKFGDETKKLREAIRAGVTKAGYIPVFIDEVQHNNYITPELLKHIRDSKFVVVDLTHQNNGAYFEEGYAMGLGKPVIQLCKKNTVLHFDISQKNTIMWETEDDITERLCNRIKATID